MGEVSQGVAQTIGENIQRIRKLRGMTVRELSARLKELGLALSASGVSEVEHASRKLGADELLIFSIALNASVIDLLTPEDGKPLSVAEGVEPLWPGWLEGWIRGETPWPPDPTNQQFTEQFFETASESRKSRHRTGLRPEMLEIAGLRSAVSGAIEGPGPLNEIAEPAIMAEFLRDQLETVNSYVKLLADHIEKHGYGG